MSVQQDCPGCMRGNHDRHDRGHGLRPGLIGGTYCGCTGDCAERFKVSARLFERWVRGAEASR